MWFYFIFAGRGTASVKCGHSLSMFQIFEQTLQTKYENMAASCTATVSESVALVFLWRWLQSTAHTCTTPPSSSPPYGTPLTTGAAPAMHSYVRPVFSFKRPVSTHPHHRNPPIFPAVPRINHGVLCLALVTHRRLTLIVSKCIKSRHIVSHDFEIPTAAEFINFLILFP